MNEGTFKPPPVTGYRNLTQAEIDLVNEIKAAEAAYAEVWRKVCATDGVDRRMAAIARTNIEDATMWLSRSVFQPVSPFDQKGS